MADIKQENNNLKGAIILAGGDSKRLGHPKALLEINGQSLIELVVGILSSYFQELTVVTDRPELYDSLPVRVTGDLLKADQKSPLRGIHAGLSVSNLPYQFVAACDMPFLNLELIKYMASFAGSYDAVVPRVGRYYQPLHAFYRRSCIGIIEKQVNEGDYKVTDFYEYLKIRFISLSEITLFDPEQKSFININTWEDYKKTLALMNGKRETS
ncbi:MAG: molybdenum cofactor guanylyltransferase [Bacillota bacterium]